MTTRIKRHRPQGHPARIAQERRIAEVERDLRRHGIRLNGSRPSRQGFVRALAGPDLDTVARVAELLWSGAPRLDRPLLVPLDALCADAGIDGFMLVRVLRALEEQYALLRVLEMRQTEALLELKPLPQELLSAA